MLTKLLRRFTSEPDPLSRTSQHRIVRIPHIFYWADNVREVAGHMRLFGDRPMKGWAFYQYAVQAPGGNWALHRRWNFGLFCIHHVEPGKKATDPAGWHITWASLRFAKSYGGWTLTYKNADTFKCRKDAKR